MESGDIISKSWPENYGRAWVELLESGLSEHARICYVAMTSFGKEARAGKTAIMKRMGVKSLSTVKGAQAELVEAGWMRLKKPGTAITPNHWEMLATAGGVGRTAPQGKAQDAPGVGHTAPPKQEVKQEDKQEISISAGAEKKSAKAKGKTPERLDLERQGRIVRDYFFSEFKKLPGRSSGATFQPWQSVFDAECALVQQHGVKEMCRRADNCLHSGYNPNPDYKDFLFKPDKWIEFMPKRVQGPRNEYDRKPRGKEEVPESIAAMARQLGGVIK